MKKSLTRISLFSLLILASGCMSIGITSATKENIAGKTYSKLMILARFIDLPYRTLAETTFKENLLDYANTDSVISTELFWPSRDYSKQEIRKVLSDKLIDGVILFRLVSSTRDEGLHAYDYEQIFDAVNYSEPTKIARGPNRRYEVSLIDAATGKTVWIGNVSISSSRPYRSQNIVGPISSESLKKLQELKILPVLDQKIQHKSKQAPQRPGQPWQQNETPGYRIKSNE